MTMKDTYKWGNLYVDANLMISNLEEGNENLGQFTEEQRDALRAFEESGAEFCFDSEWPYGGLYRDNDQLPLVYLESFGGYPGGALDESNFEAAMEWAEDRDDIYTERTRFGGCDSVTLWYDLSAGTPDGAQEAVELIEEFKDYPVLDESLWSEKQFAAWVETVEESLGDTVRFRDNNDLPELTEEQLDQIRTEAEEYYGHWEEGYFDSEIWDGIVDKVVDGEVQLKQDVALF